MNIFRKDLVPLLLDRYVPKLRQFSQNLFCFKGKAYCLCFHDVSASDNNFAIHPDEFKSIIESIKDKIVSINNIQSGGIIISFDDGFESLYTTILPYMEAQDIPFVCYITTGFLDTPGYLATDQLKALSKSRWCTIGSHMCTHRRTREMLQEEVTTEWIESKRILEGIIETEVWHAALPYGSYYACTYKSKILALKAGYKTIVDTIAVPFDPKSRIISRFVYQKNNSRVAELIGTLK